VRRLLSRDEGQAVIEYAVLAALISVVAVGLMTDVGLRVVQMFQDLVDALP
jgi:Flp pilus assembly pilin Flp